MDLQGLSMICADLIIEDEDQTGNTVYLKGKYCLDNLKDLLRFMRRDDPQTREVFKQVCKWNIVSKDLIPILVYYQKERDLVLNAVKVLVFLTMPVEPGSDDVPQQIEYLWHLKSAITCSDVIAVIVSLLETPLQNLECDAFSEDDWKLLQLVLTLFRNILAIQDITPQQKVGGSAIQYVSLRDKFIELAFHENVMDILLVITQHVGASCAYLHQDDFLLLETFHYIFMGQDPQLIAKAHDKVDGEIETPFSSLKSIIEQEKEKKKLVKSRSVCRHSQFSGTFTRIKMDGSKAVIKGKPSGSRGSLLKNQNANQGKVKKIVSDQGRLPSMKSNILKLLHDFMSQFLSGVYNVLMRSILKDIEKEQNAIQNSDIMVFFQVAQFVTSFQYHKVLTSKPNMEIGTSESCFNLYATNTNFEGDICGPIAASMNESTFLLVFSRWRTAFDSLKQTKEYKLLSAAGSVMRSMIRMLDLVLKLLPEDSKEPQTARVLLYKLFYDQTDEGLTQFLLNLIKSFDTLKQPKSDLADLIEMIHVIVRLMENLQQRGTLRVSKKSRKGRKKKQSTKKKETEDKQSSEKIAAENEAGNPLNKQTTDMDISMKEGFNSGVSNGEGDRGINPKLDELDKSAPDANDGDNIFAQVDIRKSNDAEDDLCSGNSESSGDEKPAPVNEVDFKVSTLASALANNSIIQKLCWLLTFYKSNHPSTNHYIIWMLRRITEDLELSPMLYQLSLLETFYEILAEQKSCPRKEYESIVSFLTNVVRKMLRKFKGQPLLFVEVLFSKTRRECHHINADYLFHELGHLKKQVGDLENKSGDQEMGSSQDIWVRRSIADALGEDEADVIISHGLDQENDDEYIRDKSDGIASTSGNDINDTKSLDKKGNDFEEESGKVSRRLRKISDEAEIRIKELYEKFKDHRNCSRLIAQELDPQWRVSAAQITNRLKQLGLRTARKRARDFTGEENSLMAKKSSPLQTNDSGGNIEEHLHTRKRVPAFSIDEEEKIKTLFEKFKDHRRCSYMIAESLDGSRTVTAAQISRKLKQLGLRVTQQRKDHSNAHLRDERSDSSDMETLVSLKNRYKKSVNRSSSEDLQEHGSKILTQEVSDDEILGSCFRKTKKDQLPSNMNFTATPVHPIIAESCGDTSTEVTESYHTQSDPNLSSGLRTTGSDEAVAGGTHDNMGAEISGGIYDDIEEDLPLQLEDNDLQDLEDNNEGHEYIESASRRKMRMIIDSDDD